MAPKKKLRIEVQGPHAPLAIQIDRTRTAVYVRLSEAEPHETREIEPDVLADYDSAGHLVGFEIIGLGAHRFGSVVSRIRHRFGAEAEALDSLEALKS